MNPGEAVDAGLVALEFEPVPTEQVVAGSPITGWVALASTADEDEVGVWEMTVGAMTDVEVDEVFVVVSGRATVAFDDGRPTISLVPGSVVRLNAGDRTVWTVTETLRKVYVTPA